MCAVCVLCVCRASRLVSLCVCSPSSLAVAMEMALVGSLQQQQLNAKQANQNTPHKMDQHSMCCITYTLLCCVFVLSLFVVLSSFCVFCVVLLFATVGLTPITDRTDADEERRRREKRHNTQQKQTKKRQTQANIEEQRQRTNCAR